MNTSNMPKKQRKEVSDSLQSAEKQRELKYLQDTFSSQIDPDVVFFIFSECSYNVDATLESLLSLVSEETTKGSDGDAATCSEKNEKIIEKEPEDQPDSGNPSKQSQTAMQLEKSNSIGASFYSSSRGLYHSNEDLCTDDGMVGKFTSSDPFCFGSDVLTSQVSSNCGSGTTDVLKSGESTHYETKTDAKSFDILTEVLSPQSDCSIEGDASDAIDSAFDIGVNYPNKRVINTCNQAAFNTSLSSSSTPSIQTSESQFIGTRQPFFSPPASRPKTASSSTTVVPSVPFSELFKRPQRYQVPKYPKNTSSQTQTKPKPLTPVESILHRIHQGEKVLIILRGLPGSGKSTLAQKLINRKGVICSTDNFFMHGSKYFYNAAKLPEAHEWNHLCARKAMESGRTPVIIDNTNVELWEMQPYAIWGIQYGYHTEILEPDTNWKFKVNVLAIRNSHSITREKIQLMLDRYQYNATVSKILGKKIVLPVKSDLNNGKDFVAPARLNQDVSCEVKPTGTEKLLDFSLLATPAVLPLNSKSDYVSEDPSFWHTDSGTQSDASVETVIDREEQGSATKNRFRNRQAQGGLKTVKDIVKEIVQAQFQSKDTDSNSDEVSESSNFWEKSSDNCQKNIESDTSPSKIADSLSESTQSAFKKRACKKLAAKFDHNLLLNGHFSTDVDWKIPGYPDDKIDPDIPPPSRDNSTVETQCAETHTQVDQKYFDPHRTLSATDIVLIGKDRDVTEIVPVYEPNLSGKHDKSAMTMAESNGEFETMDAERKFASLKELFPQVSEESLRDLFAKCNEDVSWVAELLLDPSYEFVDVKPFIPKSTNADDTDGFITANVHSRDESTSSEMVNSPTLSDSELDSAIDNALSNLPEAFGTEEGDQTQFIPVERPMLNVDQDKSRISVVKPVAVKTQLDDCAGASKIETQNDIGKLSDFRNEGLVLHLDPAFALQLEEIFGPTNCDLDEESLELRLDLNLAEQLYNCWKMSLRKQMTTDFQERGTRFEDHFSIGERHRLNRHFNFARRRSRSFDSATAKRYMDGEPDLETIMRAEQAMYMAQNETADIVERKLKNADMATTLKKKMLHEKFPYVDKTTLDNIYVANSCCKHTTEEEILATLENEIGVTDNNFPGNTKSDITKPFYNRQHSTGSGSQRESTNDRSDVKNQDMYRRVLSASKSSEQVRSPSPLQIELAQERRLEATNCYLRQREYLGKASEARSKGQHVVAYHYVQEARNLKDRMNNANLEAMEIILDENNKDRDDTVLDLHQLQKREAIAATKEFFARHKKKLAERKQSSMTVYIITGWGKHSTDGFSRLKQEIIRFLNEKKMRYHEPNGGMLAITLKAQDTA